MASPGSRFLASLAVRCLLLGGLAVGLAMGLWQLSVSALARQGEEQERRVRGDPVDMASPSVSGPSFLYSEFGEKADTIWLASAANPLARTPVATVPHTLGWGINASLSPDGGRIAYTVLPPEGGDPSSAAELWVLPLSGGQPFRLAEGIELRGRPVWSPDGASVAVRRNAGDGISLVAVDTSDRTVGVALAESGVLGLYPIAYSPDGRNLYYARISADGTHLGAADLASGGGRLLLKTSDAIAHSWHLSPDGKEIAYLAPRLVDGRLVQRAFVVNLASPMPREVAAPPDIAGLDLLGPIWNPRTRTLTIGSAGGGARSAAVVLPSLAGGALQRLPAPDYGFDVPLAWSPDGQYLAVRSFDGASAQAAGRERKVIVGVDGARRPIAAGADAQIIGWLPPSP